MSRIKKNLIMSICLVILCIGMGFTMYYAGSRISQTPLENQVQSENGAPSENGTSNQGMPSQKPESSNSDNESGVNNDNQNSTNQQPPEMPSSDNQLSGGVQGDLTKGISLVYYIAFGSEGLLISCLIIYFIMSRFNKKNLKETFKNSDKIIIYILATIIATTGITFASGKVTTYLFSSQNNGAISTETNVIYTGTKEITSDTQVDSGDFESTTKDQNAILVDGDIDVNLSNITVKKSGDSERGDTSNFYGNNSGILAKSGANLILKNITVYTTADGANGVFSFGGSATTNNTNSDGTTVTISNSTITTTGDNAGGIMTTGGGIMKASDLTINTAGVSSAAIRTDRGGGTVTVDNGTYTTTGAGSPSIYSTADVTVNNANLISKVSEGVVIEGKNTVTLNKCVLTDSNTKLNGQSTTYKNIFLYQSMSGDADDGNSKFTAKDCQITTNNGDSFYITNTKATIQLENNEIINNDSDGYFLRAQADSWGTSGSNGGDVTLNMINQNAAGDILIDSISSLNLSMTSKSYYQGTINADKSAKNIALKLDSTSKIKLTGDSYVTSFDDADTTYSNINFNGYKLYVNNVAINE